MSIRLARGNRQASKWCLCLQQTRIVIAAVSFFKFVLGYPQWLSGFRFETASYQRSVNSDFFWARQSQRGRHGTFCGTWKFFSFSQFFCFFSFQNKTDDSDGHFLCNLGTYFETFVFLTLYNYLNFSLSSYTTYPLAYNCWKWPPKCKCNVSYACYNKKSNEWKKTVNLFFIYKYFDIICDNRKYQ